MRINSLYDDYTELCTGDFALTFYDYGYREAIEIENLFEQWKLDVDYWSDLSMGINERDSLLDNIIGWCNSYNLKEALEDIQLYNQVRNIYLKEYPLAPFPPYEKRSEPILRIHTDKGLPVIISMNDLSKTDLVKYINHKFEVDYGYNEEGKKNRSLSLIKSNSFLSSPSLYDSFLNDIKNYSIKLFKESMGKDWYDSYPNLILTSEKQEFIDQEIMSMSPHSHTYSVLFNKISVPNTVGLDHEGRLWESRSLKLEFRIKLTKYIFDLADKYCPHLQDENIVWRVNDKEIQNLYKTYNFNYKGSVIIQQFLIFLLEKVVSDILERKLEVKKPLKGLVFKFL